VFALSHRSKPDAQSTRELVQTDHS
jgi:hypothetical protein